MGKRGVPPKPTALKILEGYRKDRIGGIKTVSKAPACPAYLPAEGKKIWQEVVNDLDPLGMLSLGDGPSLEAYCLAVVLYRKAARKILKDGLMVKGHLGESVRNPALMPLKDSAEKIKIFAREFGLTPSARSGMKAPEVSEEELEDILTPRRAKA